MMRSLTFKWIATLLLTSLVGVLLVGVFAARTTVFEYDRLRIDQAQATFVDDMTTYYKARGSWNGIEDWMIQAERGVGGMTIQATRPVDQQGTSFDEAKNKMWTVDVMREGVPAFSDFTPEERPTIWTTFAPRLKERTIYGEGPAPASDMDGNGIPFKVTVSRPQIFALADTDRKVVAGFGPLEPGEIAPLPLFEEGTPITIAGKKVGTVMLAQAPTEFNPWEQRYINNMTIALIGGALGSAAISLLIGVVLSRHFLRPLTELTHAITAMQRGQLAQQVRVRTKDELGMLAQAFNRMSSELHRANQLRIQMTADIAHDLRTPLMIISGYLEALRDGTLAPTLERFEAMNQETLLLKRLIEDLRTLSLADAGELKLMRQPLAPRELLEQVKEAFGPLAREQAVTLHLDAAPALPPIDVDRARIVQVLGNLVSNALRYTNSGGQITLAARATDATVQLVVTDTGSGIPAEKLPNIFERFVRGEDARTQSEGEGESGLGLAIAKAIVEAHHGSITAVSEVDVGTEMIITLPFDEAKVAA